MNRTERSRSPPRQPSFPPEPPRVFRACEACFKAKTKCDDVTENGCSRCRARRKVCSLLQAMPTATSNRESSPVRRRGIEPSVRDWSDDFRRSTISFDRRQSDENQRDDHIRNMEDRIKFLEDKVLRMEGDIQQQQQMNRPTIDPFQTIQPPNRPSTSLADSLFQTQPFSSDQTPQSDFFSLNPSSSSSNPVKLPGQNTFGVSSDVPSLGNDPQIVSSNSSGREDRFNRVYKRGMDRQAFAKSIEKGTASLVYDESCFRGAAMDEYPDVVKRGIVTQSQVDLAYHMFKHLFSQLIPMVPFLDISTPTPKHPFVILAILCHLPDQLIPGIDLEPIVEESILYAMTGCVNPKVILALFILSFAPLPVSSKDHIPVTPLRLIALAHSIGRDLGLDETVDQYLSMEWGMSGKQTESALLWIAVRNRYNMLKIQTARAGQLIPDWTSRLPKERKPLVDKTAGYLIAEAELIAAAEPIVICLAASETALHYKWADFHDIQEQWKRFSATVERMLQGNWLGKDFPALRHELHMVVYCVALRMTIVFANPRPPLSHEYLDQAHGLVAIALRASSDSLIGSFLATKATNPNLLRPRNTMMNAITVLSTTRKGLNYARRVLPPGTPDVFNAQNLERMENDLREDPTAIGIVLRDMWDQLDEPKPEEERVAGDGGFDLDWLGLEGLDWLIRVTS